MYRGRRLFHCARGLRGRYPARRSENKACKSPAPPQAASTAQNLPSTNAATLKSSCAHLQRGRRWQPSHTPSLVPDAQMRKANRPQSSPNQRGHILPDQVGTETRTSIQGSFLFAGPTWPACWHKSATVPSLRCSFNSFNESYAVY